MGHMQGAGCSQGGGREEKTVLSGEGSVLVAGGRAVDEGPTRDGVRIRREGQGPAAALAPECPQPAPWPLGTDIEYEREKGWVAIPYCNTLLPSVSDMRSLRQTFKWCRIGFHRSLS